MESKPKKVYLVWMNYKHMRTPYVEAVFYDEKEAEKFASKDVLRDVEEMRVKDWRKNES